jgi:hypothetical protein
VIHCCENPTSTCSRYLIVQQNHSKIVDFGTVESKAQGYVNVRAICFVVSYCLLKYG